MGRWNSITYGFSHYSAYLSLLNWLLLSCGTFLRFYHFGLIDDHCRTTWCSNEFHAPILTLNLICFLVEWQPFKGSQTTSWQRKTQLYELSCRKRLEKFVGNWNSMVGISQHFFFCTKGNKKNYGIPEHFYASTYSRASRIPRCPETSHFIPTLSKRWLLNSNSLQDPLFFIPWHFEQSYFLPSKNIRLISTHVRNVIY